MLRYAAASVGIVSRLAFVLKLETSRIRPPEFTSAMGNLVPTIWHLPNSPFTCRAIQFNAAAMCLLQLAI